MTYGSRPRLTTESRHAVIVTSVEHVVTHLQDLARVRVYEDRIVTRANPLVAEGRGHEVV